MAASDYCDTDITDELESIIRNSESLKSFIIPREFNESATIKKLLIALKDSKSCERIEEFPLIAASLYNDNEVRDVIDEISKTAPNIKVFDLRDLSMRVDTTCDRYQWKNRLELLR